MNTSGSIVLIANSVIVSGTGTQNVNGNSISGTFSKASGGTITLFTSSASSLSGSVINNNNNNFSNITANGTSVIAGWVNTDAGASSKTIQNNTFSNWTGGTGNVTAMSVNITGANNATTGNAINNISSRGAITGIATAAGNDKIYSNTIHTLTTIGASAIVGISVAGGTTKNVYRNKIYNLTANNATGRSYGISVTGTTTAVITANIYNNLIGDLKTPIGSAADPIRGISLTSTRASSIIKIYYNTIFLNATSSGATFGSSGIYHTTSTIETTATLDLRNNIIVNTSTPTGTGLTVAYRRSSTALANYAAASDKNLFYSGAAGPTRLLFHDGTNADQSLAAYKSRMASRDALSVTEDLVTTSKFLSIVGSSALYLHLDPSKASQAESGAANISNFTDDYDATARQGNAGYSGTGTAPDIGADEYDGSTLPAISGIYTVGTGQAYTSLTNAGGLFAAINTLGLSGNVIVNITSDLAETGSNSLYQWAEQGSGSYTLTIQPDAATTRIISGNAIAGLIQFNGSDRVTIDGRFSGSGTYLTFRNTNLAGTTGTAFTFVNGASNNIIRNSNIEAFTNAINGVIVFSTSIADVGNSNNIISNCNINATVGGNTGIQGIYSAGTAGKENSGNTISGNNILNYRERGLSITAAGSGSWIISDNSFYNGTVSGSVNYAAASALHGIIILGGTGYSIANNYIGGNAPLAAGTNAAYSSSLGIISFHGILLTTSGATPASNIKGNFIAKIAVSAVPTSATAANVFTGIESNGFEINIGGSLATEKNTIGSNTANGSIVVTTTTSNSTYKSLIRGIYCASAGGSIIGNQVSAIDIKNIGTSPAASAFQGIYINSATPPSQILNNIIGSAGAGAAANSIRVLPASTSSSTALTGISIGSALASSIQVDGNIIQNISHQSITADGSFTGIANAATAPSIVTINNNAVSFNKINATAGFFYAIYHAIANPSTLTITSNSISDNSSTTTGPGAFYGIYVSGTPSIITINSNAFLNNAADVLAGGSFMGIYNAAASATLEINSNTLSGNASAATTTAYFPIFNAGAVSTNISINSNNIGTGVSPAITFSAANSGPLVLINNTAGQATAALSISNNNFYTIAYSEQGTGSNTYISNTAATQSQAINSNVFNNLSVNTTGDITFISNSVSVAATGTQNINNNTISGTFTKSAAGGTLTLFASTANSAAGSVINNNSNNFSNITVSGSTVIAGWINTDAGASAKTIENNIFTNWSGGSGAITAMSVNLAGTANATTGNTINALSGSGTVTGIATAGGNDNIYLNTINALSTTGANAVTAISVTAGTTKNIYKNKVYDLEANHAGGTVNGILVAGSAFETANIHNNLIGDLRTPVANSATDATRGISITTTAPNSSINVYYNTIYLNGVSTGANFGSSGIYHTASETSTTGALNLRNNSITNTSTASGTGVTAAYRRSLTSLANYAPTSNNNLFYAGAPSSTRVIFFDGTNGDETFEAYQSRLAPADAASVTENLTSKFLSTTGASSVFLHMDDAIASLVESGAENIAGYTDDFEGQIRAGNPGYGGSSSKPDIGADEIFGIEVIPPTITYSALANTASTANRILSGVEITDASGVNTAPGTKPRIYYKRFSDANVWLDNTSSTNGWKYTIASTAGTPFSFTIDYSLLYGGASVTAGVIQYFVVAEDEATIANTAINSGNFNVAPSGVALTASAFPLTGTINSYKIPFSGTYNVGASEVFTSFTKANGLFAAINSVGLMGNTTILVTSNVSEDGITPLQQWTESGAGNYTLAIRPNSSTKRNISGNAASGLIRLDGADRVAINGNYAGSGDYLDFLNTNTSATTGTAFSFINGASGNTIKHTNIAAYANATNGAILFGLSSEAGGNSNNLIDSCLISATVSGNTGAVAIYSAGTAGNENAGNTLSNNNIINYRDRGVDIASTGSNAWNINRNHFYNGNVTGSINYAALSTLHGIRISGGSGYSISGNFIGGSASEASGTNARYSSSTGNVSYQGILLTTTSTLPASVIKGNTIASITVLSAPASLGAAVFTGIETNGLVINIGGNTRSEGNVIGYGESNGSINIVTTTTAVNNTSNIVGINCLSSGGVINNNRIGGIDISNTGTGPAPSAFQGIYVNNAAPPAQVNANLIGSSLTPNSIRVVTASAAATTSLTGIGIGTEVNSAIQINKNRIENISNLSTTSSGSFTGIQNLSVLSNSIITIQNDTIQHIATSPNTSSGSAGFSAIISSSASTISNNLVNNISLAATGPNAQVRGISASGAYVHTISNNTILNLSTASGKTTAVAETGSPAGSSVTGILNEASVAGQIISDNTLSGLNATSVAAINTVVTGIGITSTVSGRIYNNTISAFANTATGAAPAIRGIMAAGGSFDVYNNSIRLSNSSNNNGVKLYGIAHATTANWNYYHNSVRISGSSGGTAVRSAAFILPVSGSLSLRNNIFVNTRTGSGSHYAISNLTSPPGTWPSAASNYNNLYSSNLSTVGEWGIAVNKTFSQWKTSSGGDANSVSNPVSFIVSPYDLQPDSVTNCNINNAGTPITIPFAINTDINADPRSLTNPDLGAYEFNYAAFTIVAGSNSPVCAGDSVVLSVNAGEALGPAFNWRNPANAIISTLQNPTVFALAGQYKASVTDVNGCNVTDSTLVSINQRPTATISAETSLCDSGFVYLQIAVTGSGAISGMLSNEDVFSGTAPLITVPVFTTATTSYSISELTDGSCAAIPSDFSDTVTVLVNPKGDWLGINNNWHDTINWCGGIVPSSATNVNIPEGTLIMPLITDNAYCKNLTINTGDTVTVTATGTLHIAGALINYGIYTDNGTTDFNGTSGQQSFSGVSVFNNLSLSNSAGLLLPSSIIVKNNVTISAGTLNAANFDISVAGNWSNNASLTALTAGSGKAIFNGTAAKSIGGSFTTRFNDLTISKPGSIVSLSANASIAGNLLISAGTFDLGAFTANRATAGGSLTVANNATLKIGGTNSFPANYTAITLVVASTVEYSGTNQTVSNQAYGNLRLSSFSGAAVKTLPATALMVMGNLTTNLGTGSSVSFSAASNINVNGNVTIGASTTFNGGNFTHTISGNWSNTGTFTGNASTIVFNGTGALISGSGIQNFNNLTIAASGINFSSGSLTLTGNLATALSGSLVQASGGTLLMSGTNKTISGTGISLSNLTVSGSVSTSISFGLTGNLSVSGSLTASNGTITMSGSAKTITGPGIITFYVLVLSGSVSANNSFAIASGLSVDGSFTASAGTATFTGTSSLSGSANLFNANINGTSLQLSAGSTLGIANALIISSGALNVTSSGPNTVNFNGTGAQNINGITYSNLVLSNGGTKTAVSNISTLFDINIQTGASFNPSSHTISVYGNWINNGTFIPGTSTVEFAGPATASITGVTTFNILTSNTTNASTELILNNHVSATTVNMANGIILTGSNLLTITGTRTGNGIILGNIRRAHAFTTGVAYAFEGPDNTIIFSAVSAVSSITVSVAKGFVSDFPFGGSISRVYDIAIPAGSYTATLRLHYEDNELNGNNESSMGLWHYNGSSWAGIGKTGNSATSNYVEQSGLTDISNRWTASGVSNLVRWNGSQSSDWNTAANWTVLQGVGSRPPSSSDIVDLGTATFGNQPTISSSVTVKSIIFGSGKAVTLTLTNGGSLTTLGDLNGNWTGNATHAIEVNSQALTVNGSISLSDGTSGHAIDLNIGSGTVTTLGTLIQTGEADINFNGSGTLNIHNDFNYSGGTFSAGSGTVFYSGTANQAIASVNYNNLVIDKATGLADINDTVNIAGDLVISSGQLDNFSTTSVAGDVTIDAGATVINHDNLHVQGNWNNNGTYTGTGSSIFFDGTGTQNISASTFNNFYINKPSGTAYLTGNVVITSDVYLISGILDLQTYNFNRNILGGQTTHEDAATLMIGANNPPRNFSNHVIGGTTIFYGSTAQFINFSGITFKHLIFRGTGLKSLQQNMIVTGDLTIENGASFSAGSSNFILRGNWINNGTFIPGTSTAQFQGAAKSIGGNTTFNIVTVTGSYAILNNVTFNGLLEITNTGSLSGGNTISTTLHGDLINSGILYTLGTTTFSGNVQQTLSLINAITTVAITVNFNGSVSPVLNSTSVPQYGFLNINNTGGINPSVGWTIAYSLNVGSGASFNGGPSTHNILGSLTNNGTITSSGTLNFIPSSPVTVNLGNNFSSTGTVIFGGTGAMTMAGSSTSLNDVVISNSNATGIAPSSDWIITDDLSVSSNAIFNAGSHLYTVSGDISNLGILNRGGSSFILNGAGIQTISSPSPFNNVTVSNSIAPVVISSDVAVYGVLNFISGNIKTGDRKLFIPSTGSITGAGQATGWIDGNLEKNIALGTNIARAFEVGDSLNYTPVAVSFSLVTASGNLTTRTTASDHPNLATSELDPDFTVNRYYTISNAGTAFTTAAGTFNWVPADVDPGANTAAFNIARYNGTVWTLLNPASALPTSIQGSPILAFGNFAIGNLAVAIWTGDVSTDWFTAENWSSGVPVAVKNATIPGSLANYPVLDTGMGAVRNITIQGGAALTVNGAVLRITGAISNSGTFTANNGTILLNGSSLQTIPANAFAGNTVKNLTINNTAGAALEDSLLLSGILLVANGQLATSGHLTLLSSDTQTALIDGSGTGQVIGSVTMQRYLASGFGYKYFSSPFQASTVNEFADDLDLEAPFPSFYRYNEDQLSSGWINHTDPAGALNPMEGYVGNFGASASPVTVDITGVVNNDTISAPLLYNHNRPFTWASTWSEIPIPLR